MSQEAERPEPTTQATPANIPQVKMPSVTLSKDEVQRFFNEATKYTIFGIFILYSIGFLIWHSYLAEYGVSSFEFLQVEYFSATICYLIFVTIFALPAALLYMVLLEKKKIGTVDASTIVFIWSTISYQFLANFFPGYMSGISSTLMSVIFIITALMCGYVILYGFLTINLHFKWTVKWGWKRTPEAMRNLVGKLNFVTVSVLAIGIIYCFSIPELSKPYLIFSLFLYPVLAYGFEMGGRNHWNEGGNFIRILIVTFCALVIVGNIQLFGAAQFGKVSRQMGGGKSETAYVRFAPQYLDLPALLSIPVVAKADSPSGFAGPIQILMRSDKQLVFLTPTNTNSPEPFTNLVSSSATTNVVAIGMTNQASQIKTNLPNMVANTTKLATKPAAKMAAKQVRADLIDAIIFVK
jgi:hypothetical protein